MRREDGSIPNDDAGARLEPPSSLSELCTLSAGALEERLAMVRREIQPHASARRQLEDGIAWDFVSTPEMKSKLENLARLERQCCAELDFDVWEDRSGERLRFEIRGADPRSGFFDALDLSNPNGDPEPRRRRWNLLRAGGLGLAASIVVCCVLPVALVSLAGVAIAAPLIALDDPWIIAAAAVVFATLFAWIGRRGTAPSPRATGTGPRDCGC